VTDYYWANVKVSDASNTATQPIFGETNIIGGLLKITNNNNTTTIGSQNASFCHVYNSASIPFIVNNSLLTTSGNLGNTTYRWDNIYMKKLIDVTYSTGGTDLGMKISGKSYSVGFIIGTANVNRGIYDYTNGKWIIYKDDTTTYIPSWISKGSATNPVYFDSTGKPEACTYSLNKTVPSDAKFTDTTYNVYEKELK
jgi:hypothetical protein